MPTLIENVAIPENSLIELAAGAPREIVSMLLASPRVRASAGAVESLLTNEYLTPAEAQTLRAGVGANDAAQVVPAAPAEEPADAESEAAHQAFQQEYAAEIAAEEGKPFELTSEEESETEQEEAPAEANQAAGTSVAAAAAQAMAAVQEDFEASEQKKLTILQKISRMKVGERIKLGFIGGREERSILIRDTAKLVQNAVLQSPKLTDPEAELFAGSKNLQENVFREIARQRRFLKLYPVVRNLVNNPKCPLDISLTLVKSLMIHDLKALRHSKGVPDTIRKVAAKLYQEKASRGGAKKE
jgi:hypothetical protein